MAGRLVTIGSKGGPALRNDMALPTSNLIEMGDAAAVVDCGLGVTQGLVRAGIDLRDLPPVFITHLHGDHVLELGPLIYTAWVTGLRRPARVFGPAGLADYWAGFLASIPVATTLREGDKTRPLAEMVELHTIEPGPVMDDGRLTVSALRVDHPTVSECFALRFEGDGRRVTFSADTTPFEPLAGFAWGSHLLVHEATLPEALQRIIAAKGQDPGMIDRINACHTPAPEAARLAGRAAVRRLVLYHLIPGDQPSVTEADWRAAVEGVWDGDVTIARDGLEITF